LTLYLSTGFILLAMRIGAVAAQAKVNDQTLRYYERAGLLPTPARAKNGYRNYPPDTVALVRFIKRAQELGFSLADASALSELRRAPGRNRLKVRTLAQAKLLDVEQKIADLTAIRTALQQLVGSCCADDGPGCPILEALAADTPPSSVNRPSPKGPKR
jgi:DNA-binding transcriptional MerR regulator